MFNNVLYNGKIIKFDSQDTKHYKEYINFADFLNFYSGTIWYASKIPNLMNENEETYLYD